MSDLLSGLLNSAQLWRASENTNYHCPTQNTGIKELNQLLPGSGWPLGNVTEMLCDTPGIGEIRLLAPLLQELSKQDKWMLWVSPPFLPYPSGLESQGINHQKVLLARNLNTPEKLWAAEQGLRSGQCSVVLLWADRITNTQVRRLQTACVDSSAHCFIFRQARAANEHSSAPLRLGLSAVAKASATSTLQLSIIKCRGRWPHNHPVILNIPAIFTKARLSTFAELTTTQTSTQTSTQTAISSAK
ncbi:MAG: translesion DNA synthesis-associated protein ImuA [Hahellaceae bacterium]|nr:translesion DNA synthesis-associated protein ImuA [Hahellaceae bacterium]MCP5211778.1 translesion DNA synthesis-associated protein ImuA [Hahellaceae bacterium]